MTGQGSPLVGEHGRGTLHSQKSPSILCTFRMLYFQIQLSMVGGRAPRARQEQPLLGGRWQREDGVGGSDQVRKVGRAGIGGANGEVVGDEAPPNLTLRRFPSLGFRVSCFPV